MTDTKKKKLQEKKTLLNSAKISLRKKLNQIDRLLANVDPDSPLFTKYTQQKQQLVVSLYETENDYDTAINKLQEQITSLEDKNRVTTKDIKQLIKERTEGGFLSPKGSRLGKDLRAGLSNIKDFFSLRKRRDALMEGIYNKVEDFFDKWDKIKNSYMYRFFYTGLKVGPNMIKTLGKGLLNLALTKKVNQKKILGFIPYGGKRVGRFKFNNNLLRKYSSDYKEVGRDFYLLGKGLYNKNIKEGALDAGDIISYMRSQGKDSEEILKQLKEFSRYGLEISDTYMNLLQPKTISTEVSPFLDEDSDFEDISSNITYQNEAILIDQQNKESLKEALFDFYKYIENKEEPKKQQNISLTDIWKSAKSLKAGLVAFAAWAGSSRISRAGWAALIIAAIAGAIYYFKDEIITWGKEQINTLWQWISGEDTKIFDTSTSKNSFAEMDAQDIPTEEDFEPYASFNTPKIDAFNNTISPEIQEAIQRASEKTGVDPYTIASIIQAESNFNPNAIGKETKYGRAMGLMQLLPDTFEEVMGKNANIMDIQQNIEAGARYYKKMYNQFGSKREALAAYNWGPGHLMEAKRKYGKDWIEHLPKETANYLKRNLGSAENMLINNIQDSALLDAIQDNTLGISNSNDELLYNTELQDLKFFPNNDYNNQLIAAIENELSKPAIANENQNNKQGNNIDLVEPIKIPSHLGGGGLDILNTGMRM